MIRVAFRPIDTWPGERTERPKRSPFKAGWSATLDLLDRELRMLEAERPVVQLALGEEDIRLDGWPRANARPLHPGVILAFDSRHGPLKYATDTFDDWQDNLRAVALGLEALRKVDRYGITKRGEQYTGWRQLTAGAGSGPYTRDEAARLLIEMTGITPNYKGWAKDAVRQALKATHPDTGGDPEEFGRVQRARELLGV